MLRELLAEAGWTGEALARAVNAVGAEAGVPLRYGRASVTHWLSGMCPRQPVPEFVAEAFSRKLNRPIPVGETGMVNPARVCAPPARWWETDVVSRLLAPHEADAGGSEPLAGRRYRLSDLDVPSWPELARSRPGRSWTATPMGKIEQRHVQSAAAMIKVFSDMDLAFGGGHARQALASYLAVTIAPCLRATATPAVRRELLTTASRLTYLCGFMCFDDESHGAAQHYYLTTLRLAAEAGDATGYAVTLRALSVQAYLLGHHRQAVDLAETAVHTAASTAGAQTSAFLLGQLAVARAASGDRWDAVRCLATAERHLDRAQDAPAPVGGCHTAALAHQQAVALARLGDRSGAIKALTFSVRHRPVGERRARAITLARLAELQLDGGELETACETWQWFLQDYPNLRSRRIKRALASMRARLRPHQNTPAVTALRNRTTLLGRPWLGACASSS